MSRIANTLAAIADAATPKPIKTRRTRQPIKALSKSPEAVAANTKADAERKKASKKALRQHMAYDGDKKPKAKPMPVPKPKSDADRQAEHEAYLAALRVDAAALGVDPDAYIAEQLAPVVMSGYTGPMLALRRAAKNYVKATNGQPCCGDELAQICGAHTREAVVAALLQVLGFGSNPYAHLNAGQQSMNLRNKARAAIKNGTIQIADVQAALAA
jgi:hypothetical protein